MGLDARAPGSTIAHDLNNLLGVIRSYAEMALEDASMSPTLREDVVEIRNVAEEAIAVVRRLAEPVPGEEGR